jgi:co-chaperonin GroES (HSP10)
MPYMKMTHAIDPKKAILDEIGDLSTFELFNNKILLATYKRPEKTKSGIILTDNNRSEDTFQSKVGLLIKIGPSAFEENAEGWFAGEKFELGDWIVHRPSDGWSINVHGVDCRILADTQVQGRAVDPDEVW